MHLDKNFGMKRGIVFFFETPLVFAPWQPVSNNPSFVKNISSIVATHRRVSALEDVHGTYGKSSHFVEVGKFFGKKSTSFLTFVNFGLFFFYKAFLAYIKIISTISSGFHFLGERLRTFGHLISPFTTPSPQRSKERARNKRMQHKKLSTTLGPVLDAMENLTFF